MSALRRLPIVGTANPANTVAAAESASLTFFEESRPEAIGEHALFWHRETTGDIMARIPPAAPLGCAEGCAYCCHLKVIASPSEVIHLARFLRRTRSPDEVTLLLNELRIAHAATVGKTTPERALLRLPCPLLREGRCSAYQARPLHCAGANSYDAAQCKEAFDRIDEEVPVGLYQPQAQLADLIGAGISRASFVSGRAGFMLELIAGLLSALEDESRCEAWERGENAFETAIDRELFDLIAKSQTT